jgi:hypothetical protein
MYLPQIKVKDGVVKEVLHFQCLFLFPTKNGGLKKEERL